MMTDLKTYASECFAERLCTYAFRVDFDQNGAAVVDDQDNGHDPGEPASDRIHRLTKERMYEHRGLDYRTAMREVLGASPDLVRAYADEGNRPQRARTHALVHIGGNAPPQSDPSVKVHREALRLQQEESCTSYSLAVSQVLSRDPQLASDYYAWTSNG